MSDPKPTATDPQPINPPEDPDGMDYHDKKDATDPNAKPGGMDYHGSDR